MVIKFTYGSLKTLQSLDLQPATEETNGMTGIPLGIMFLFCSHYFGNDNKDETIEIELVYVGAPINMQ
jgi:hypothetical protein